MNAMRDATGKKLERLVAMLERALAGTGASIEAPSRRLIDRDTGRTREHDVLITWDHGHHQIVTAIECRDRSRPVGVPAVEAFADKCASTGVNSGVIVSSKGFCVSARTKAEKRAITCMEIAEVERFDWLGMEAFVGYNRKFSAVDAQIIFKDEQPKEIAEIYDVNGTKVTPDGLTQTIIQSVPSSDNPESEVDKIVPVSMRMETYNWTVRDAEGKIWNVDHILARTSYHTEKTVNSFETHRYHGGGRDYAIASADVPIGEHRGKIMMVQGEDGRTSIYWTPHRHAEAA